MSFRIQDKFEVSAPVDRVWRFLIDPNQVAVCIPGAELTEVKDKSKFAGNIKIRVGPVTVGYKGVIQLTEVDDQIHQVRMVGEGRETAGGGSAKVTMVSRITPAANGGAEVTVDSEVDLVGKIVQFGRGMIEEVAKQLFQQFSRCVKQHLEAETSHEESPSAQNASAQEPVPALALTFRALWAIVLRAVGKLVGKQSH